MIWFFLVIGCCVYAWFSLTIVIKQLFIISSRFMCLMSLPLACSTTGRLELSRKLANIISISISTASFLATSSCLISTFAVISYILKRGSGWFSRGWVLLSEWGELVLTFVPWEHFFWFVGTGSWRAFERGDWTSILEVLFVDSLLKLLNIVYKDLYILLD